MLKRLRDRPDVVAIGLVVLLVAFRSAPHVVLPSANFDSDQALLGIMGIDVSHARHAPFYCYGQRYLLAIISWLAAPLFALFGTSVAALKIPLVTMNAIAGWLLYRGLRGSRLTPTLALVASLPLVVPSVYMSMRLVAAHGCTIEPFVGVLLMWALRERALAFGVVGGVFYLNREFTLYAVPALVIADLVAGRRIDRPYAARRGVAFVSMAAVIVLGRLIGPHGAFYGGPGAFPVSLERHPLASAKWFVTEILPPLLGAANGPYVAWPFTIGASLFDVLAALLAVLFGLAVVRVGTNVRRARDPEVREALAFPAYLVAIGMASTLALVALEGMPKDPFSLRYAYFVILGASGLLAAHLILETNARARAATLAITSAFFGLHLALHATFFAAAAKAPPSNERLLAAYLTSHGVESGRAPYWVAYHVSFLADEKVMLTASDGRIAVPRYEERFLASPRAVDIQRDPCEGGENVATWWICKRP